MAVGFDRQRQVTESTEDEIDAPFFHWWGKEV
jgi:hypothetical protein